MVGEDSKGVLSPTQVVPPMGEGFHHGKQLSLVDIVVPLCWGECSGVVRNGMEFGFPFFVWGSVPLASFLGEHCSDSVCGGVGL